MTSTINTPHGKIVIDNYSEKIYDNNGNLISLKGVNKMGDTGLWIDEDGLCTHERVYKYCQDCGLDRSVKNLLYELGKSLGVLWLIDHIPFLERKQWVKDIED